MCAPRRDYSIPPSPYSYEVTLERLDIVLSLTDRYGGIELLNKAKTLAQSDPEFQAKMRDVLLYGSTTELRELVSVFGDYLEPRRPTFPPYPFRDAVNALDSALDAARKCNPCTTDHVAFVRLMRSMPELQEPVFPQ
jgi:hypothetical protein